MISRPTVLLAERATLLSTVVAMLSPCALVLPKIAPKIPPPLVVGEETVGAGALAAGLAVEIEVVGDGAAVGVAPFNFSYADSRSTLFHKRPPPGSSP